MLPSLPEWEIFDPAVNQIVEGFLNILQQRLVLLIKLEFQTSVDFPVPQRCVAQGGKAVSSHPILNLLFLAVANSATIYFAV